MSVKSALAPSTKTYQVVFILLICLGIAFCEWVFSYRDVTSGIIIALFLSLAIYLTVPLFKLGKRFRDSAESLVLLPLYILFTASLPWFFLSQEFVLPAVYSAVLTLCAWHIYRKKLNLGAIGFKKDGLVRQIIIGMVIGIPLGVAEYFIITPVATSPSFEVKFLLRDFAYMVIFVGLGEELLFRALVQRDMSRLLGWKWGLILASLMFGVMHLTWRSLPELGFTAFAGLVFGYLYYRSGSLAAPVLAHGAGNTVLVAIMPYLIG